MKIILVFSEIISLQTFIQPYRYIPALAEHSTFIRIFFLLEISFLQIQIALFLIYCLTVFFDVKSHFSIHFLNGKL